jgi:hypothetical protein
MRASKTKNKEAKQPDNKKDKTPNNPVLSLSHLGLKR